jgi:glycosyltransferase involved in cell wall biosynthesis
VLILNYNSEQLVAQAIDSALSQTEPFDEVVVVNDGSSDGSMEVIGRYADRVRIVDKPNGGQLTAALAGLAASRADYVYVLDADDFLEPVFVAAVRPVLADWPVKVQCQLVGVDGRGEPLMSVFPTYPQPYDSARMRRDNERIGFYVAPPTAGNVYQRACLERLDLARLRPNEPLDGPPSMAAPYFGEVATICRPLAYYRVHGSNSSRWDKPDAELLQSEIDWFYRRWLDLAAMSVAPVPAFGAGAPLYVRERRLMLAALGGRGVAAEAPGFIAALWRTHVTPKQKLLLTAWALALLTPSPRLRRFLVRARRSPVNRPRALKRFLTLFLPPRPPRQASQEI